MSNVRDISEGRLADSLAYVFAQLRLLGAKNEDRRQREPRYHRPLTPHERAHIRRQLRRDLRASLDLIESKKDQ